MANGLIVQKYGGSSLSTPDRIRKVAHRIASRAREGSRVVVAVSAMGSSTDELLKLAYEITPSPPQRELDMLLTVGERISMALLSMALNSMECRAISFTGSQSGIVTNVSHTRALIEEIRGHRIEEALANGYVVIVAGFQGVSRTREITTLGRGGSDTSAVAIAASLGANRCEIFSDVPGVFTADPRIVKQARRLPRVSYDEMLELAVLGAKVLHFRAAELARRYRVPVDLLSSFDDSEGTTVRDGRDMERECITGVMSNKHVALIRLSAGGDGAALAGLLRQVVEVDLRIISYQRTMHDRTNTLTLVIEPEDVPRIRTIVDGSDLEGVEMSAQENLSSVSVVGSGLSCSARTIARIEGVLANTGIPVSYVGTTTLAVTCLVPESSRENAVGILHSALVETDKSRTD